MRATHPLMSTESGMATQREQNEPQPLEGEALVRAIMADEKLVAEALEAQRRADAGEASWVRWEDVKREMDTERGQGSKMVNARKRVKLTPEGEALRREAMSRANDIREQYEESQRREAAGEKPLYIRHGSPEEIRQQLRGL